MTNDGADVTQPAAAMDFDYSGSMRENETAFGDAETSQSEASSISHEELRQRNRNEYAVAHRKPPSGAPQLPRQYQRAPQDINPVQHAATRFGDEGFK